MHAFFNIKGHGTVSEERGALHQAPHTLPESGSNTENSRRQGVQKEHPVCYDLLEGILRIFVILTLHGVVSEVNARADLLL